MFEQCFRVKYWADSAMMGIFLQIYMWAVQYWAGFATVDDNRPRRQHLRSAWSCLVVALMTDVFTLLVLPKTSIAFTSTLRPTIQDSQDGSASPRRKTPRLETDSDAPSASRSKRNSCNGSIRISVIGDECVFRIPVPFSPVLIFHIVERPRDSDPLFLLLRQSIRRILTREAEVPVKHSYESIYAACRALVTLYDKGEGIYGNFKIDLEQSLGRLADHLETFQAEGPEASDAPGVKWIEEFVKACRWFEEQIVRLILRLICMLMLTPLQSLLQSLLTYLDRAYVLNQRNLLDTRSVSRSILLMPANAIMQDPRIYPIHTTNL